MRFLRSYPFHLNILISLISAIIIEVFLRTSILKLSLKTSIVDFNNRFFNLFNIKIVFNVYISSHNPLKSSLYDCL